MSRRSLGTAALAATVLALLGCNELLNVGRFEVGDGGVGPRDGGGMDGGGADAGSRDGGGVDAGPPDAGPCDLENPDADGDGFESIACGGDDCDDTEAGINPGEAELCDDIDQDCDPRTLGPDADGDGQVSTACCNGGVCGRDCDDGPTGGGIFAGATETCDDVDQDCDGAIDEGLLSLLGPQTTLEPDYGIGDTVGFAAVAHSQGFAIVWKNQDVPRVRAAFFGRDGTELTATPITIEGGSTGGGDEPKGPRAIRYERGGLEQIYVIWTEDGGTRETRGIFAATCEVDGSGCTSDRQIVEVDPTELRDLQITQAGSRVAVFWEVEADDTLHVVLVDPSGLSTPREIVVNGLPGAPAGQTEFDGGSFVEGGAPPYLLFTRGLDDVLDGGAVPDGGTSLDGGVGTYTFGRAQLLRVGIPPAPAPPTFDETTDVVEWGPGRACASLGTRFCALATLSVAGTGELDRGSFAMIEGVIGFDSPDGGAAALSFCVYPATPRASGLPDLGDCEPVESFAYFVADRGTVATTAVFTGTRYALRELALDGAVTGSTVAVPLPNIDLLLVGRTHPLSAFGGHGVVVGNLDSISGFDLTYQRLGCMP